MVVRARIGGIVTDPSAGGHCRVGRIADSVESIEGSSGPDQLYGDGSANNLDGRGGDDFIDGRGGEDRCAGGGGRDRAVHCEERDSIP